MRLHHLNRFTGLALCLSLSMVAPSQADNSIPSEQQAKRNAQLFDEICYSNLPDQVPIKRMAKQKRWTPITGTALKAYAPEVPPEELRAWSFLDRGIKMRVSISAGPVDDELKAELPTFAKARALACSLILPGLVAQKDMVKALLELVGRPSDENYKQTPFRVQLWRGITQDLAAMMYYYQPQSGRPGGLISFVVLKNDTPGR